ncbi:MAG: hypothetical protein E6Q97_10345 [Desulfurellales bacterium]|nr:MAG: hypothetical protein E6Q97_10345 [Desulfurellales bacterium]
MKFAPIVPIEYLDLVKERDYHLILPHLIENSDYASVYKAVDGFKILDNGEAEGLQPDPEELFRAANAVSAHEIVVPDTLRDADRTIEQCREFSKLAAKHPKYSYMAVVQGSDLAEIMKCFMFYQTQGWIQRVAFPRAWYELHRGLRASMAESMADELRRSFLGVHCLGANAFLQEPILLASIPGSNPISGMDTSLPASAAIAGEDLSIVSATTPRQDGFFEYPYKSTTHALMEHNINVYTGWCR